MSKRFIETTMWTQNKWFRKLSPESKLLWMYLISNCDPVGVWEEDVEFASFVIGCQYSIESLNLFEDRLLKFNGKKYWIKDFCTFQYGELKEENTTNKPHQSYISLLKKHSLWIDYTKSLQRPKEKEKDKDKDKAKDKDSDKDIEDGIFIIPTLENIKKYAKEQNIDLILAEKFFNVMETDDWFTSDRNGNKKTFVKNNNKWMRVLSNWNLADIKNGNGKNKIVDAYKELGL